MVERLGMRQLYFFCAVGISVLTLLYMKDGHFRFLMGDKEEYMPTYYYDGLTEQQFFEYMQGLDELDRLDELDEIDAQNLEEFDSPGEENRRRLRKSTKTPIDGMCTIIDAQLEGQKTYNQCFTCFVLGKTMVEIPPFQALSDLGQLESYKVGLPQISLHMTKGQNIEKQKFKGRQLRKIYDDNACLKMCWDFNLCMQDNPYPPEKHPDKGWKQADNYLDMLKDTYFQEQPNGRGKEKKAGATILPKRQLGYPDNQCLCYKQYWIEHFNKCQEQGYGSKGYMKAGAWLCNNCGGKEKKIPQVNCDLFLRGGRGSGDGDGSDWNGGLHGAPLDGFAVFPAIVMDNIFNKVTGANDV